MEEATPYEVGIGRACAESAFRGALSSDLPYLPNDALDQVNHRCAVGAAKHGVYEPLPVVERLAKIRRHLDAAAQGDRSENHLAAIAANALYAMEQERIDSPRPVCGCRHCK